MAGSPVSSGGWEAQFFGPTDDESTHADRHPSSVAGMFDAHSSHGHVGGGVRSGEGIDGIRHSPNHGARSPDRETLTS